MRKAALAVFVAGLVLGGTGASAQSRSARDGEARLTRMLEGRTAGVPLGCVSTLNTSDELIVIDEVGVVYDSGNTFYVARVTEPEKLRWTDRVEFVRASHKRLCATDKVWTFDRYTGLSTGMVQLGEFVPYRRS